MSEAAGDEVIAIEKLGTADNPHPLQTAFMPMLARGFQRRRLSLHPIPGFSRKENHTGRKPSFASPKFRLIPRWNQIPISGSFLDWNMLAYALSHFLRGWRAAALAALLL